MVDKKNWHVTKHIYIYIERRMHICNNYVKIDTIILKIKDDPTKYPTSIPNDPTNLRIHT
jgi:hypothetical protein